MVKIFHFETVQVQLCRHSHPYQPIQFATKLLMLLLVLAVLSCAFTLVISNVGACTLLAPLGNPSPAKSVSIPALR